MPTLFFSGQEVAFFESIDEDGNDTTFGGVTNPFRADDIIEIEIRDNDVKGNGEFKNQDIEIQSFTVVRNDVRYEISLDEPKIKAPGGKEQGDSFFTSNDEIELSAPFGTMSGKMAFGNDAVFTTNETTTIARNSNQDFNEDGDTNDSQEGGNGTFNAQVADTMPCFGTGTLIGTPNGPVRVEHLKAGDVVLTYGRQHGRVLAHFSAIVPCGAGHSENTPILFRKDAFAKNLPDRDTVLSPQHCIAAGHGFALGQLAQGTPRLLRAKALCDLKHVRVMRGKQSITYHALLLNQHSLILANGVWVESLWPGALAIAMFPTVIQEKIERLFPGVHRNPETAYGPPALPIEPVQKTRRFFQAKVLECTS